MRDHTPASDARIIRHAASVCADRDLSLMLAGLADYAACHHDDADAMDDLADRLNHDLGELTAQLRDGSAHLRDYPNGERE